MLKKLGSVNEPVPRTVFYFHLHGAVVLGVLELFCGQLTISQLQQTPLALMLIFLTCAQFARALGWGKGNTFLGAVFTFSGVVLPPLLTAPFSASHQVCVPFSACSSLLLLQPPALV